MPDFHEIDDIIPLSPVETRTAPAVPPLPPARHPGGATTAGKRKGIAGVLTAIGIAIAKWWAVILSVLLKFKAVLVALKLLTLGKLFLTGGTMLLSMFLWSYRFGWPMAIGIVLSIFVHECGHAFAAWRMGQKLGIMVFIPFMGAVVTTRGGRNVTEDAIVGIMGPVAGSITALVCVGLYSTTSSEFWLVLAMIGFFINLINLAPGRPLDGGWIAPLFSPKLLLPGIVLVVIVFYSNPVVWIMAIMSIPGNIYAWKHGSTSPYFKAKTRDRWILGLAYIGMIAFLATSYISTGSYLRSHYPDFRTSIRRPRVAQ